MNKFKMSASPEGMKGEIWIEGEILPQGWLSKADQEFLALDLNSLETFKADMSGLENATEITVHLNSPGGDAVTGVAIYNALKAHPAKVRVVVDGLAASAASVIACAGDETLIYPASAIMIHSCSELVAGWISENDARKILNGITGVNKMATNAYAEKTGLGETVLKNMMSVETWLVGEQAVALGFADKVIDGDALYEYDAEENKIMCGGAKIDASRFKNMPMEVPMNNILRRFAASLAAKTEDEIKADAVEVTEQTEAAAEDTEQAPETGDTEITDEVIEEETQTEAEDAPETPDVVHMVAKAMMAERNRIRDIEKVAAVIGDKAMVEEAKFGEQTMTADELSRKWLEASAAKAAKVKADIAADYKASGAAEVKVASSDDETAAKVAAAYKAAVDKFNEERQ